MNVIAEIDKAGRIVVPKKMRDALHLVAGTRLAIRQEGDRLTLEPESKQSGLVLEGAVLVRRVEGLPSLGNRDWVEEDREARLRAVVGDSLRL